MIRINTAPLGMQNLLSGNRKLYKQGGTPIKGCYGGWHNGDKRLLLNAPPSVSNTPAVIYKSETDSVVYCPISPRIIYENIDNRTHEISIRENGCNSGEKYKKDYVIESGQTVEIDRLPWEQMKRCGLMAGNMSLGVDEYLVFKIYNDDTDELIEEITLPKYGFIGIHLFKYGYTNLKIEGFVNVIES